MALERKGRSARSALCRHWLWHRKQARQSGADLPLWVLFAPPWPVIRLAMIKNGGSLVYAMMMWPVGILASWDTDGCD